MRGRVVRWYADKNFGFVKPDDGSADVFLHASNLQADDVEVGWRVEFDVATNQRNGKLQAINVRPAP
jgi:CspA family cold shock protein